MNIIERINEISGVNNALFVERIGFPSDQKNAELSAMTASLWWLGEYYLRQMRDEPRCITIEGKNVAVFAFPYRGKILLVTSDNRDLR